jgi:hypothetical protein
MRIYNNPIFKPNNVTTALNLARHFREGKTFAGIPKKLRLNLANEANKVLRREPTAFTNQQRSNLANAIKALRETL